MDECIGRYGRHRLYGVPVSVLSTHSPTAHQIPYTKSMIKQHNGMFLVNDTAANDPACQAAMQSYMDQLRREEQRRQAIRQAAAAGNAQDMGQYEIWNISDRH